MIEREAGIRIYNDALGVKGAKGRLVRIAEDGYYEVSLEVAGGHHTAFLPIASTVIMAAEPDSDVPGIEVER